MRTFATSRYKAEDALLSVRTAPLQHHELLSSVYDLIHDYSRRHALASRGAAHLGQRGERRPLTLYAMRRARSA